jgi:16S rRNA processing protein RimM
VIGFTIHDTNHGELGPVEEVLDLPMQQVFRILKGECEILIPAVESIILSIDREARTVQIKAPEGLIDLYLNEGDDDLEPDIEEENS